MSKKFLNRKRIESHKKRLHRAKSHPFVVPVLTIIVLCFFTLVGSVSFGAQTVGPADSRVVTVYADGESRTLPTRAQTVEDLLTRLGVSVDENDVVEPKLSTKILEDGFTVNIYRSRPVIIVDGKNEIAKSSAQQSARAVAKEAGLKLFPEDIVEVELPEDALEQGVIAERIVIERSIPIRLVLFGKEYLVRTHSNTVGELLEEKQVEVSDITVFPKAESVLKKDSVVYVTSPGKKIVSVEEEIPFGEETIEDESLPLGTEEVREEGKLGKRVVLYEINKKDPKKRTALQSVVAFAPQPRVTIVGTGVPTSSISGSKTDWMRAAGIDPSQYPYVDQIIARESGWNPGAVSANRCIGLGQRCSAQVLISECPAWQNDPVCQLGHFNSYAVGRYGSWQNAYSFWQANHWW
jgi:uncharacterized protein YabE (DUF348 family)